jgi:phenylpropionate dioxygenase-like ring-hydroxylating dioxygenase large terminal subunit
MFLRNCWYMAGWSRDFSPNQLTAVTMLNEPIVIYRTSDGAPVALQDRCCHRFAPLSHGRLEGDDLRCMYHGLKFAPSGKCIEIPGQPKIPPQACVRNYPIVDRHSGAWIWMGDPAGADESLIPDFVGIDDPRWVMHPGRMDYKANYMLINDNLLDLSHLAFLHRQSFGAAFGGEKSEIWAETRPQITRITRGMRIERWQLNNSPPAFVPAVRAATDRTDQWTAYDFIVPGVFLLRSEIYKAGTAEACHEGPPPADLGPLHAQFTCQAVTPLTDKTTCYFFAYGPRVKEAALKDAFFELGKMAFNEDLAMIEAQQKLIDRYPDDKMMTTSSDSGLAQFRRMVAEMMREEAQGNRSTAPSQMQAESAEA